MLLHLCLRNVEKVLILILWGILTINLGGCVQKLTDKQIDALRQEALARNSQLIAKNATNQYPKEWKLLIQGQIDKRQDIEISWNELLNLSKDVVKTIDANNINAPEEIIEFKGIRVSRLLEKFGINPTNSTEITFLCFDSYQVTLKVKDLFAYPITLAIAKNGKKLTQDDGGPIYLIFPYTEYSELKQKYTEMHWAFYVTNMIVDTEMFQLQVGDTKLKLADLDKLPQQTISEKVGYRGGWSSDRVKLHGVWMRDVFALVPQKLPTTGSIKVIGKSPIHRDSEDPILLNVKDIRECDILLATRWGNERKLIDASKGGPVTIAFRNNCNNREQLPSKPLRWLTFVEKLSE